MDKLKYAFLECDNDELIWNKFVKSIDCFNNIGLNPSLRMVLYKTFKYQDNYQLVYDSDLLVAVFPSIKHKKRVISIPQFSYGDILISNLNEKLKYKVQKELFGKNYLFRSFEKFGRYYETDKVISFLKLKKTVDEQWLSWKSKLRSQIKKGLKNNLEIKRGNNENLLNDFYFVYSLNMKSLGSPSLSISFFENLLKYYKYGDISITCVFEKNKVIGAGLVLEYNGFSEVCWASTLRKYNYLNANMILYWEIIKLQVLNGVEIFSFGRSSLNSGQYKFKQQWGAETKPIFLNKSHESGNFLRKLSFLTKIWSLLPIKLTKILGGVISKHIY